MENQDIRNEIAGKGFKLWQVAEKLGIADCQFSRKLRRELPDEYKARVRAAASELMKEREI